MTDLKFKIYTPSGITDKLPCGTSVVALGNFDGVHVAHQALLRKTIQLGKELGADTFGAWCFDSLPSSMLDGKTVPLLTPLEEKLHKIFSLGIDFVAVGDFQSLRSMGAQDFIEFVLKERLHAVGAACGFNHRFGCGGAGTPAMLENAFEKNAVSVLSEVRMLGQTVSSSAIRALISEGNVSDARAMLGRAFALSAPVVKGKQLGRKLGFPTANQYFESGTVAPAYGIYATVCTMQDGKRFAGVSNVGIRPTITDGSDDHRINCETYMQNFAGDLYGKPLRVEFCKLLRREQKFSSTEELKAQIERDLEAALAYFKEQNICF